MKMPQEKNGENTDLKCDLVLFRNKDYENGGHHKMKVWRRMEKISWTEHIHVSNEVLKLVEEERSVNDNKNETTELDGTYNERRDSLQREIQKEEWIVNEEGEGQEKLYWTG